MRVKIGLSTKMAEHRVIGFDDSVTLSEVVNAVALQGACYPSQIKCREIRNFPSGLGSIWVKYPLTDA